MTEIHKSKTAMVEEQQQHIVNKLQARTSMAAEALPQPEEDTRDPWFAKYEKEHYDNPDDLLYRDDAAYQLQAALAGKDTSAKNWKPRVVTAQALSYERGVVIVLIDSAPHFEWPENGDLHAGDVLVCTGETQAVKPKIGLEYAGTGRFRTATGDDPFRLSPNTLNARYATDAEVEQFVKDAMASKPMNFIRLLGDASEFVK